MKNAEIWKPIAGHEGFYDVSNKGRVRRCSRDDTYIRSFALGTHHTSVHYNEMILHPSIANNHLVVFLRSDGGYKAAAVSRLVALAFISNPDPQNLRYVCHKDRNPSNNEVSNLYWSKSTKGDRSESL